MASSSVEKLTMSKPKRSNPDSSQGPSSKKSKNEDFSFPPSTFEEELALLESMDPPPAPVRHTSLFVLNRIQVINVCVCMQSHRW